MPRSAEQHEARARILLADVYEPEGVDLWLIGAKRSFGGERPVDLLHDGRQEQVFHAIERLRSGAM